MRREPAKFLGFEFYVRDTYKVNKVLRKTKMGSKSIVFSRNNNTRIVVRPDLQRMLNRAFIKRFCDKKGFPLSIPWISNLEAYAIIERYNACIRGLANFYAEWVTYPSTLNRWLYILKYSCLKTLAQKYHCSIKKIFKRFGIKTETQDTVKYTVTLLFPQKGKMSKDWTLITGKEAVDCALSIGRKKAVSEIYETIEKGDYLDKYKYPTKDGRIPRVMDENFLEKINWVTRRAVASLGMPCTLCEDINNVEMHHIKHVRKMAYSSIQETKPWLKLLSIKNRKQIPVCFNCHRTVIHGGGYYGPRLSLLAPIMVEKDKGMTVYDGRQVNIENFVQPGENHGARTLEEKGWYSSEATTTVMKRSGWIFSDEE
jgi:hypothetical protein